MTHAQELREIADKADAGSIGPHNVADELRRIADELEALKAREPVAPQETLTAEEARSCQRWKGWKGMDGVTAFQLIERHADGWDDIGQMMNAWLEANSQAREPMTDEQMKEGRERIFSVDNPFCPCTKKTFEKVTRYVEAHHNITSKE